MKFIILLISLALVTAFVSCKTAGDNSGTESDMTTVAETSITDLTVPKSQSKEIPKLPYGIEKALLTGAPIGSSPRYFKFSDGLTCYIADNYNRRNYECTLALPDGYTEGNIVYISGGAGSGEVFIGVSTVHNGETVYLDYYFYAGDSLTDPIGIYPHDERALPYLDIIGGKNQVLS